MKLIIVLLAVFTAGIQSARILGVIPTPAYSHQAAFYPLWRELSLKGHQVTLLTTNPIRDQQLTNLTEVDLEHVFKAFENMNRNTEYSLIDSFVKHYFSNSLEIIVEQLLGNENVQALIQNQTEHFDILLVEGHHPLGFFFAARFNCPFITLFSLEASTRSYRILGNPTHPAVYPDIQLPYSAPLNIFQRSFTVFYETLIEVLNDWVDDPLVDRLAKKYFGDGLPPIAELKKNVSVIFTSTDFILHPVRPLLPNVIEITDGSPTKFRQPIPADLKTRLDAVNKHGFVYFSMGSIVKSKYLEETTRQVLLEAFSKLPQLVLWKLELDEVPALPPNVIISKWFPQENILKHHNIRVFITQCGRESMLESIHNGVPMVGLPLFADQFKNVRSLINNGMGVQLDFNTLTASQLVEAVKEVASNPKYKQAVKKASDLIRDQPMKGVDKAVWWTEYVIRHKGAHHLRSPALDIPWYQYYLLDVVGFSLVVVVLVLYLVKKVLGLVLRFLGKLCAGKKKLKKN